MTPTSPSATESWEKECLETFFVYNMKRGKHGDHVGAQDELISFIRQVRAEAVEETKKSLELADDETVVSCCPTCKNVCQECHLGGGACTCCDCE